jgi:hypothetical protein
MIPFQSTTSTHSSSSPPNLLKVSILQNFLFRLLINELRRNQGIIINRPSLCCISVKYSLSTIQITFPTNQSTTKIFTRTFFSSIHSQFLSFIHLSITTTSSHLISSNHSLVHNDHLISSHPTIQLTSHKMMPLDYHHQRLFQKLLLWCIYVHVSYAI